MQVGGGRSRSIPAKLQDGHSVYQSNHPHEAAYQHNSRGAFAASVCPKFVDILFARPKTNLSIHANRTSINFDNDCFCALAEVGRVSDADHESGYLKNPFNFQNFGFYRIDLIHNGIPVPRQHYTTNFANGQYTKDYYTMVEQFECDYGDECFSLSLFQWANGYTIYAFKITNGLIGADTNVLRSKSPTVSVRLEVAFAAAQTNISR